MQTCTNTQGGYTCGCLEHFKLKQDQQTCEGGVNPQKSAGQQMGKRADDRLVSTIDDSDHFKDVKAGKSNACGYTHSWWDAWLFHISSPEYGFPSFFVLLSIESLLGFSWLWANMFRGKWSTELSLQQRIPTRKRPERLQRYVGEIIGRCSIGPIPYSPSLLANRSPEWKWPFVSLIQFWCMTFYSAR